MQFIERSAFELRAAIYTMKKDRNHPKFILFPMIHIGSPQYYENIRRRLEKCDKIVVEGVGSAREGFLTLSYRFLAKRKSLGLVTQQCLDLSGLERRVVHGDVTGEAFDHAWSGMPARVRWLFPLLLPIASVYAYLFWSRREIADHFGTDDLPSRDEVLKMDEDCESIDEVLLHRRDAHLVTVLKQLYENSEYADLTVGIIYGAAHMRAVKTLLVEKFGFRVERAEWEVVFDL